MCVVNHVPLRACVDASSTGCLVQVLFQDSFLGVDWMPVSQTMVADQFHAFCFLSRAPRLVMAPSTFSWWAAFLGNATEVHFPFQPSRRSVTGPQVVVYDEPRYVYRNFSGNVVRPSF